MKIYDPEIDGGEWSVVLRWMDPAEQTAQRRAFHRAVREYAAAERNVPLAQSAALIFGYRTASLGQQTIERALARRVA